MTPPKIPTIYEAGWSCSHQDGAGTVAHRVTRHAAHHQLRDGVLAGLGHHDEVCANSFRVFGDNRPNCGAAVAVDGQD